MDHEKLLRIKAKCKNYFMYMKYMSLIVLAFLYLQNQFFKSDISSNLLISKINAVAGIFQIVLFLIFIYVEEGSLSALKHNIVKHIFMDIKTTFKMALPSIFLILSSELLQLSSNILPVQSQSANNYFIIGVALFTTLLLKKKFYLSQALSVYFVAKGLDQFPPDGNFTIDVKAKTSTMSTFYGHFAILWAILCYGLSYAILEKLLKSSDVSLWIRGIQLNLFTVPLSMLINFTNDWTTEEPCGFFANFNLIAWFFIIFKIAQRMMELFVIKVVDSVYRSLALAAALIIIGFIKHPFAINELFTTAPTKLGFGLVMAGICLYSVMDHFPKWGEIYEPESEGDYRESPVNCTETVAKGYQNVPTVSSSVERSVLNADVYLK